MAEIFPKGQTTNQFTDPISSANSKKDKVKNKTTKPTPSAMHRTVKC